MEDENYIIELQNFGRRVKKLREERGLLQLDLELMTGINRADISKIENGLKNIEFFTIYRLAKAFEIEIELLFTNESLKSD